MTTAGPEGQRRFRASVVSSERITPEGAEAEVRELVLDLDDPGFSVEAGQCIGVAVPRQSGEHFRLYSVADLPEGGASGAARVTICVRRCSTVDPLEGTLTPGIASNYLCDLGPGDALSIVGPVGTPFEIPDDVNANLILICTGTGIAPFRTFVKGLYREYPDWRERVWLFYGARNGLELLYLNDEKDDFAQYYDRETFRAFRALSPRPNWADPIGWDHAFAERGDELWRMLSKENTYVYVAGQEKLRPQLDSAFALLAGSRAAWERRRAELNAAGRWVELLY